MEREELPNRIVRGWGWLQAFVVAIVAILIAYYFYKSTSNPKYYPAMKFNSTTLYPTLYISDDENTLTNRPTGYTSRVSIGPDHLHRYTGVFLKEPLSIQEKTYIEVSVSYRVVGRQYGSQMVFEIGFSEKGETDKFIHLRETWGTIFLRAVTNNEQQHVCFTGYDGKLAQPFHIISEAVTSTWYELILRFYIDPTEDVLKITYSIDNEPFDEIFEFIDVGLQDDNKWPVIGIYNPHLYQIHMKLPKSNGLRFDSTTVHPMIYISDDELELSNIPTNTTFRKGYRDGQLQKYEGVIANISIDANTASLHQWPQVVTFDVKVEYEVTNFIGINYLFEIGLCRSKYIDKHWSIGPQLYSLSVYGSACTVKATDICLISLRDGSRNVVQTLSSSQIGTHFRGVVSFSIDLIERRVIVSVFYKSYKYLNVENSFTFNDVDMTEPLWPVFALYKHSVDTSMKLNENN